MLVKREHVARGLAVALMVGWGGAQSVGAQDDQSVANNELGVGLYLGNCDNLVEGAALFDLGDAELETENFQNDDENSTPQADSTTLEEDLQNESNQDETDVEGAIGDNSSNNNSSDQQVVVQGNQFAVYASLDNGFDANLADLVDAPFAIAIRQSATDTTGSDESTSNNGEDGGNDFIACGEFGGAVAGNQIIIPLSGLNDSSAAGIAILEQTDGDNASTASIYLFTDRQVNGDNGGNNGDDGNNSGDNGSADSGNSGDESSALDALLTPQAEGTPSS